MGFLNMGYKQMGYRKANNPVIDTLELGTISYIQNLKIIV